MPGRIGRRIRQRVSQRAATNRPVLSGHDTSVDPWPTRPPLPLVDAPPIPERHPTWYQVHRIELRNGDIRAVLIGEFLSETRAYLFAGTQRSRTRIRKWGSGTALWYSLKPPRIVP